VLKRVVAFIDGENLTSRYQHMRKDGRIPHESVAHEEDSFVWSPQLTQWSNMDLLRVNYYTSVTGDDDKVSRITRVIGQTRYSCRSDSYMGMAQVIPRVHKKPTRSVKSKVVDVDITIDIMRASYSTDVDAIFLVSGDGDYAQLVREVSRTAKQVYVGALSSGVSEALKTGVEQFIDLDDMFFKRV
jgi:uncharacterized LabA/DUF88 family protein